MKKGLYYSELHHRLVEFYKSDDQYIYVDSNLFPFRMEKWFFKEYYKKVSQKTLIHFLSLELRSNLIENKKQELHEFIKCI